MLIISDVLYRDSSSLRYEGGIDLISLKLGIGLASCKSGELACYY